VDGVFIDQSGCHPTINASDAGLLHLHVRCSMLDARCSMLDARSHWLFIMTFDGLVIHILPSRTQQRLDCGPTLLADRLQAPRSTIKPKSSLHSSDQGTFENTYALQTLLSSLQENFQASSPQHDLLYADLTPRWSTGRGVLLQPIDTVPMMSSD
jgi:hypothetical protein